MQRLRPFSSLNSTPEGDLTTPLIRTAIRASELGVVELAERYNISLTRAAKLRW